MEVKGIVFAIGQMETVGAKAMSKQQLVLLSYHDDHDKYVAIDFLGEKNVSKLGGIQLGDTVTVKVDLNSREWNGKWYTNCNGWSVTRHRSSETPPPQPEEDVFNQYKDVEVPAVKIAPTTDDEDLPF